MKQSIYFGNVTERMPGPIGPPIRPISSVTNSIVTFTGFDLGRLGAGYLYKLDLLFYNRVNELGEILSSLVYISDPLNIDNVLEKRYDVRKLYANTSTEITMGVTSNLTDFTYFNSKWKSIPYFVKSLSPLVDTIHDELSVNGNPSVKLDKHGISFDGWYTQMSVAVRAIAGDAVVPAKDILAVHTFAGGPKIAIALTNTQSVSDDDWSPYTTIVQNGTTRSNGDINIPGTSLANIINTTSADNPFIKQDIFILPTYLELYDMAVVQYAKYPTYGNPFPILRNKHRVIDYYAKNNLFIEAQYILQSTDFLRMTTQL